MSTCIKIVMAMGVVASLAACGKSRNEQEYVVVDPEPISVEPVYTGKYK